MTYKRRIALTIIASLFSVLPMVAQPKKPLSNTSQEASSQVGVPATLTAQAKQTAGTKYYKSGELISVQEAVNLKVYYGDITLFDKISVKGTRLVVTVEAEAVAKDILQVLFSFKKSPDLNRVGIDLLVGEHEIPLKAARDSFPRDGNSKEKIGDILQLSSSELGGFVFTFPGKTKKGYMHLLFDVPPEWAAADKSLRLRFSFLCMVSSSIKNEDGLFVVGLDK